MASAVESSSEAAVPDRPEFAPLRRRLLAAGTWSLVGRLAAIGLFFLTDMILARALPKSQFGAFYLITQATVFLGAIVGLGAPQILSRTIRQTLHGPNPGAIATVIKTCSRLLILGSFLGAVGFALVGPWLAKNGPQWAPFGENQLGIILWACLGGACLNAAFALQALDDFFMGSLVASRRGGILPNLLFLGFSLIAWQAGQLSLNALIYAQAAFQGVTLLVAHWAIQRRIQRLLPNGIAAQDAIQAKAYLWYLREGLPFLAVLLISMAIDELDGLWVGRLVSGDATADYGAAKRMVRLLTIPFVMFGLSLAPFVAELLVKNEIERLQRIMRAAATLVSLPMLVVLAAYMFFPGPLLGLAFGDKFREAAPVLRWLAAGQCFVVIVGHSPSVLLMAGRQRTLLICSLTGGAAYAAMLIPASRHFGVTGAAAAQALAVAGQAFLVTLLARRQVGVWTAAALRPGHVRAAIQALRGRRRAVNDDSIDGGSA
jgi:O-antigen/teichoic acid export membrane protein